MCLQIGIRREQIMHIQTFSVIAVCVKKKNISYNNLYLKINMFILLPNKQIYIQLIAVVL